ncbi:uncharacterized protein LOC107667931 [Sinocyclocheilus anshuiensis]|uniref:uncharacterized protein LOC107667931 n=1 Tax=Sinocyclocheilus anshuiensis TaxID=1608454 RepID=UPI0007B9CDE3|nr:PREDICTED: uncharacterized protein LOC107667931 [Sinocyclocheilus anshuiensis]
MCNLHVHLHMYFLNDALGLSGNIIQSTTDNQPLVTTQQDSDEFCMNTPSEDHNTERTSVASQESSKFERAVLLRLNQVDERLQNIERLLRTNMCSEPPEGREILEKPCNTPTELEDLCTMLKDPAYKKRVIDWLSLMGGNTPEESVRRLLRKHGTNALWAQYSLKGRKGKKNFQELEICNVIIHACRRTHTKVLEKVIEDFISETLKFAPHRDKMLQSKVPLQPEAETCGKEYTQNTLN